LAARWYSRIERYHCHSRSSLKPNHHHEHKMDSTHSARATHGRHDKHEACSTGCHSIRPHERNSTEQTLSLPSQQRQRPDTCHSIRPHERNRYTVKAEQTPRLPFQRKQRPDILTSKQRHSIRPHERNGTEQTLSLPFQQSQRPDTCHSIRPHERNRYTVKAEQTPRLPFQRKQRSDILAWKQRHAEI